jgi:hypothetical protein
MRLTSSSALLTGFAATIVALGCASSGTGSASSPAPSGGLVTAASVRALLEPLAHDSMEGRAIWTRGMDRSARMIAAQMAKIGLEPVGDSGFFQRIPGAVPPPPAPGAAAAAPGRGGRGGGITRLPSIAAWDTIPAARRRTAINVVSVLRPAQRTPSADSIVLVGAHFDHLPPRAGGGAAADTIFNGADDDASGVVAVLEIARAMKAGPPPKRTIVFVAFTGEESGFVGTNWYIAHPFTPLGCMVADFQVEMIGRPDSLAGGFGRAWLTGYERSTMGDMLKAGGIPIGPDMRPTQGFFSRSDNYAFARAGIPAHTLSSFNLHREYHTVDDETSLVDYEHMAAVINAAVRAVRILADGPAPTWHPGGQPAAGGRGGAAPASAPAQPVSCRR